MLKTQSLELPEGKGKSLIPSDTSLHSGGRLVGVVVCQPTTG